MSQMNLLSVDVGQTPELQGSKGDAPIKNQAKANAFSEAMEQHYPRKPVAESENKNNQGGNFASKAADQPQVINKDGALNKLTRTKADDAHTLPVPLPVDDETSIGPITASDKTQILPITFPIDNEAIAAQLKAEKSGNDDAHTLPVPLPIDDESLVTKPTADNRYILPLPMSPEEPPIIPITKFKDSEHTLPVPLPLAPAQAENRDIKSVDSVSKIDDGVAASYKQSFQFSPLLEAQSGKNITGKVENDDAVDLLKMLNGAQQLLTKSATEQTSAEPSSQKSAINAALLIEQSATNNKRSTPSEQAKTAQNEQVKVLSSAPLLSGSKNIDKPINDNTSSNIAANSAANTAENVSGKLAENITTNTEVNVAKNSIENVVGNSAKLVTNEIKNNVAGNVTKNTAVNLANNSVIQDTQSVTLKTAGTAALTSEQKIVEAVDLLTKPAHGQTLANAVNEANAALDKNQEDKQLSSLRAMQNSVTDEVSKFDLEQIKKTTPELNAANKVVAGESNEAKLQVAELKQASVAEFNRVNGNEPAQSRAINQSTAAVISALTADPKAEANQKTVLNEDTAKLANTSDDEQTLLKAQAEKQAPQADKVVSAFNQTLDAQAARPITSAAELAAHQEQSFENTINQLTTNTVQAQKSITAMNTETIAIYRKDFADAVKDKVMVMINQKIQQVEIQLDPPEMGNIHVKVNLQNEQAAVQFVVQNQQAKEALEQNMGKLRDMLAESGVDVGDANIEQRQAKEQNGNGFDQPKHNGKNEESAEDNFSENDNVMHDVVKASSTGVDYYA